MMTLALYCMLAGCAIVIGVLAIRYDLHEREPGWLVFAAVAMGAGTMFVAGKFEVWVLAKLGTLAATNWNTSMAITAGVTEEIAKLVPVLLIAAFSRRHFNERLDGLVYGSFVGLGAAIEESIAILAHGTSEPYLPATEPIRLAGHLVMGGITCFGASALLRDKRVRLAWWVLPLSVLGGIALHITWDLVAFDAADLGTMRRWHTGAAMALMFGGMIAYRWLVRVGAQTGAGILQGSTAA